jgi:prolipoprotein diacylglyceryltransferase
MRPHLVDWLDDFMSRPWAALVAPTWFTCIGLAGVLGVFWILRDARRQRVDVGGAAGVILWGYLAAVLAGIAVPMLIDTVSHLVTRGGLSVRWSGMTSFWGYLAGFAAVLWMTRRSGIELPRFADLTAAPLGGALILCRLGCFLAGCDFGKVSSGPLAMRFPSSSPAWHEHVRAGLLPPGRAESLPVHPTQLYEAGVGLAMIAVAVLVGRTAWATARPGRTFLAVAATYGLGRIGVEVLRGDASRGLWLGLSSGQLFAVALLAAVAIALVAMRRHSSASPRVAAAALALVLLGRGQLAAAWPAPAAPPPAQPAQPAQPARPAPPQPAQPAPAQPAPAGDEAPLSPYPEPGAQQGPGAAPGQGPPATPPYYAPGVPGQPPQPVVVQAPSLGGRPRFELGVTFGGAFPLNRPEGQVASLSGPTISFGMAMPSGLGVWLDFDSLGNDDASHGTLAVSGGVMRAFNDKLAFGGRIGLGFTMVNFDEPVFRDVVGSNVRFEGLVNYQVSDRWQVWLRPLSLELLQNADLGGPIATWQIRLGVAARFGERLATPRGGS